MTTVDAVEGCKRMDQGQKSKKEESGGLKRVMVKKIIDQTEG